MKKPYLIAEIGINHNGDINEAKFLIEASEKGGCQAVKFQYRSRNLYNSEDINSYDLGTQYIMSEINRTFLSIFVKIFIDFGGFVLACIEADFCE